MLAIVLWATAVIAGQIVALVFLLAGLAKLFAPQVTGKAIEAYGVLPRSLSPLLGAFLPWIELAIAFSLLTGLFGTAAAVGALTLLVGFSLAQTNVRLRGKEVSCGCFGSLSTRPVRWSNVLTNLVLAAFCLVGIQVGVFSPGFLNVGHPLLGSTSSSYPGVDLVILKLISAAFLLQFLVFGQVLENRGYYRQYLEHMRDVSLAAGIQGNTRVGAAEKAG